MSWGVWDGYEVTLAPRNYVRALQRAGAIALILPPDEVAVADPDVLLDRVDALLLAGGADIDPSSYGAEPHPETKGTWPERDAFELALTRRALERDMPVLGICRGMQLINVAMGGTLDQHLPESIGDGRHRSTAGSFGTHRVRLAEGTLACGAAGTDGLLVMSHHHQGVGELGEGLDGQRLVGRRRDRRGDRAARPPLRPRRRLAPRGGRDVGDHPGAGRRRARAGGLMSLTVIEPATAKPMAEVPQAGVEETDAAVARAKAAFPAWRDVTPGDRATLIHRLADALAAEHEELAQARGAERRQADRLGARARSGWRSTPSAITRARRSGCSARRSRSPAAST